MENKRRFTFDLFSEEANQAIDHYADCIAASEIESYALDFFRSLSREDQVIMALYADLQSLRKVGAILGLSKRFIMLTIQRLRKKAKQYINN